MVETDAIFRIFSLLQDKDKHVQWLSINVITTLVQFGGILNHF